MTCPRCHGLMVTIKLEDAQSSSSYASSSGWQCLLCGEVIDPGIKANRKGHREPVRTRARLPNGTLLSGSDELKRERTRH